MLQSSPTSIYKLKKCQGLIPRTTAKGEAGRIGEGEERRKGKEEGSKREAGGGWGWEEAVCVMGLRGMDALAVGRPCRSPSRASVHTFSFSIILWHSSLQINLWCWTSSNAFAKSKNVISMFLPSSRNLVAIANNVNKLVMQERPFWNHAYSWAMSDSIPDVWPFHDVENFKDLTCQTVGPIIFHTASITGVKHWGYICSFPVFRNCTFV